MPRLKAPSGLIQNVLSSTQPQKTSFNAQQDIPSPPRLKAPRELIDKVVGSSPAGSSEGGRQPSGTLGSLVSSAVENTVPTIKNVATAAVGSLPDLVGTILNATGASESVLGRNIPSLTQELNKVIERYGGPVTEDKNLYASEIAKFLGGILGTGGYGSAIKAAGTAARVPKLEKAGEFIGKFGETRPSAVGVGASVGGGSASAFSKENDLPWYSEIPVVLGSAIAGGKGAAISERGIKNLLGNKSGAYEYLASKISPEDLNNLAINSIKNEDFSFLSKETLDSLPTQVRSKLENKIPFDLTDEELQTVINSGGSKDYANHWNSIQEDKNIFTTLGEEAGSADLSTFEKNLANKANVDKFDKALAVRRQNISQNLQKTMNEISGKNVDKEALGDTIEKEVNKIYEDARKIRREQWNKDFGEVGDQNIVKVPNFMEKLIEFSKLKPNLSGNEVAIRASKKQLSEFIPTVNGEKDFKLLESIRNNISISPKEINEKLAGFNEDLMRFPDRTFSRKQISDLKGALEKDLDTAAESGILEASMVKNARENYKKNSEIIDQISDSILSSRIDKGKLSSPEKISKAFDTMEPSQLKLTIDALKRSDKYEEVLPQLQRYYLESAFDAANKSKDISQFNYREFVKKLPDKKKMEIIFGDSKFKDEVESSVKLIRKIIKDEPLRGGSQTAQRLEGEASQFEAAREATGLPLDSHIPHSFYGLASHIVNGLKDAILKKSNNAYAQIMLDPAQRKQIYKFVGKMPKKKTVVSIGKKSLIPALNGKNDKPLGDYLK